jgi:hypothetical protein
MAFRTDKKEEKSLERAQKEAEMVSEFAKDARNRSEAKTISNKLEAAIELNEEKQAYKTRVISTTEQEQAIENVLNETKDNIRHVLESLQERYPNTHKDLGTYKNKPFRLQEKLLITI